MSVGSTEIRIKGKDTYVPSAQIDGRTVITSGKFLAIASVHDEELIEGETVRHPNSFISELKNSGLKADIFTFAQNLPDTSRKYTYDLAWDNVAAIPITTYSEWWEKRVESSVRRAVKKAAKSGIVVKVAEFDDEFVRGIVGINNETPIRQGRAFWHFRKSFEDVRRENSTYPGRNAFLGAYYHGELIGFIRIIYFGTVASIIQLLSMMKHYDKRPANALIAKAVELCAENRHSHLMYCNYVYNDPNSSLTEFKRRNGFEQFLLPRYYVPLTLKGKIALRLGLHRSLVKRIPKQVLSRLLKIRSSWYERRSKSAQEAV
ncbi:MAG: hypothetical protein WBE97_13570 [Candidatus Acidiferrales bacterium]